jgi:serine/threonine-protein kinase
MIVPDPHSPTGQRVKRLDFGVAKLRDGDPLTKSGSILGTPLYMALEHFKNSADVDGKADVFALGVIAYQLLTGRLPHHGATHYEIMGSR